MPYRRIAVLLTGALLLLVPGTVSAVQVLVGPSAEAKATGSAVVVLLVAAVLLAVVLPTRSRPGLTMSLLGGCGVCLYAVHSELPEWAQWSVIVACVLLGLGCVWAGLETARRLEDRRVSHFG